jgi:N-acyl-L-homoserine lactone synthetase
MIEFRQPRDEKEKEMMYRLRYEVYCLEKKFVESNQCPDCLEHDELDNYSVQFVAIDSDVPEIVMGCFRLILNNPLGFPIEKEFGVSLPSPNSSAAEVSRLILAPSARGNSRVLLKGMCREIYLYCKENKVRYCYAIAEKLLLILLKRLGLEFQPLNNGRWYMNGFTIPTVLDLQGIEEKMQKRNPEFYEYATRKSLA